MTLLRTACLLAALHAIPAWAQCVMCREAAASQKASAVAALNSGILLLGLPVAVALFGIGRMLKRYGSR